MRLILDLNNRATGSSLLREAVWPCLIGCVMFVAFSILGLVLVSLILSS